MFASHLPFTFDECFDCIPRIIDVPDLAFLFSVEVNGLHIRCRGRSGWKSIWPNEGYFIFEDSISEGFLIAKKVEERKSDSISLSLMPGTSNSVSFTHAISSGISSQQQNFLFGRRGDFGKRAVPSMRSSAAASLKEKKQIRRTLLQRNYIN